MSYKKKSRQFALVLCLPFGCLISCNSFGQSSNSTANQTLDEVVVYGSSPLSAELIEENSPYSIQSFSAKDISQSAGHSIADILNAKANGVTINHAQNNPLQPDVQVRGFSASPLLGAPQGVAVYMNGSRINEAFGDTVNWDLVSTESINQISLVSGANSAYGLNALGASLVLQTKTGFSHEATQLDLNAGSFGRKQLSLANGANNGRWGHYLLIDSFKEEGWRDFSPSKANTLYGALSFREQWFESDLFLNLTKTNLKGNGAAPEELIEIDRKAVFTHPDQTENNLQMVSNRSAWSFENQTQIIVNAFYRRNLTDSFNGDGSEFEECDAPNDDFLCDDDEPDEILEDQFGNPISSDFNAINNISQRDLESFGASLEYQTTIPFGSFEHNQSFGLDFFVGNTEFESQIEIAQLRQNRSTTRSGLFVEEGQTELESSVDSYSFYWLDNFAATDKLSVNLSLRYNHVDVSTQDLSGEAPDLNADHTFSGLNGGVGGIFSISPSNNIYANIHQSSRAPSPVELACSHPEAPCTLPNTFLADPPLQEVIARNIEFGFRHLNNGKSALFGSANIFLTKIKDDIIFQTTGGVSSNEGFFSNASDTQRFGFSGRIGGTWLETIDWQLGYSWLQASYENNFIVSSPNHPLAFNDQILVSAGDSIPGLAEHNINTNISWQINNNLSWSVDAHFQSGVYLRGDEANLDNKTDNFTVLNTQINYVATRHITLYAAITNMFDTEYETFGLYGEPDEVIPSLGDENTRFLSPSEPRAFLFGLTLEM